MQDNIDTPEAIINLRNDFLKFEAYFYQLNSMIDVAYSVYKRTGKQSGEGIIFRHKEIQEWMPGTIFSNGQMVFQDKGLLFRNADRLDEVLEDDLKKKRYLTNLLKDIKPLIEEITKFYERKLICNILYEDNKNIWDEPNGVVFQVDVCFSEVMRFAQFLELKIKKLEKDLQGWIEEMGGDNEITHNRDLLLNEINLTHITKPCNEKLWSIWKQTVDEMDEMVEKYKHLRSKSQIGSLAHHLLVKGYIKSGFSKIEYARIFFKTFLDTDAKEDDGKYFYDIDEGFNKNHETLFDIIIDKN